MIKKLILLFKQIFGIIDVYPNCKSYYYDNDERIWETNKNPYLKELRQFRSSNIIRDDEILITMSGDSFKDVRGAIYRSAYIRNNISVFRLILLHRYGEKDSSEYMVFNHPNGELKFVNIENDKEVFIIKTRLMGFLRRLKI